VVMVYHPHCYRIRGRILVGRRGRIFLSRRRRNLMMKWSCVLNESGYLVREIVVVVSVIGERERMRKEML